MMKKVIRLCASFWVGVAVLVGAVISASVVPHPTYAGWRSLSGTLGPAVTVNNLAISPDSAYVVYTADIDVDDQADLYSIPISATAGTTPQKLNLPLPAGGNVINFLISPDSQFVVYVAVQEVDERRELYVVPIAGGMPTKLSGSMVSGGNVSTFQITPDGLYVVFTADRLTNEGYEVFSVPLAGGAILKLNPALGPGDVSSVAYDPASKRVVFLLDDQVDNRREMFSTPVAGGTPIRLNPPVEGFGVDSFSIYPGFPFIIFSAQTPGGGEYTLYSVATADGGILNNLTPGLSVSQRVRYFNFDVGTGRVIYELSVEGPSSNSRYVHLFSVLLGGGGDLQLTSLADPMVRQGPYDSPTSRVVTSDGKYLIYGHQTALDAPIQLRSISLQGAPQYATLFAPASNQSMAGFQLSPDGQWVAYIRSEGSQYTLVTTPPNIDSPVAFGTNTTQFGISPDSQRVLYVQNRIDYGADLFSAQIFGGDIRNLTRSPDFAYNAKFTPDGQRIVYLTQLIGPAPDHELLGYEVRVSDGLAQVPTPTPTATATTTQTPTATPQGTPPPTATATPTRAPGTPASTPAGTPSPTPEFGIFLPSVSKP